MNEIDIYFLDDTTPLPEGMRLINDRPGHACLAATRKMRVEELIKKLEDVASRAEYLGRIKVGS